jgi:hypothetical protein
MRTNIPLKFPMECLITGNIFSEVDGMQASGIPPFIIHALELIDVKDKMAEQGKQMAEQSNQMVEIQNLIRNSDAGKFDGFLQSITETLGAHLANVSRLVNNSNSLPYLSSAPSSSSTLSTTQSAMAIIPAPTPVTAPISHTSVLLSTESNIITRTVLDREMQLEISEWKKGKQLYTWGGSLHHIATPLVLSGKFFMI